MSKKLVVICDDQKRFIDTFITNHREHYTIHPVGKVANLIDALKQMETLPDILLLDLYYPRDSNPDFEQRRLAAEQALRALDEQIATTKKAVDDTWEPFGVEMLKLLRESYTPEELPIAIYTQKGLLLLEDHQLLDVERHNGHWLLKKKLTPTTEKCRIDRIISYWKPSLDGDLNNKKVFIIHGHDEPNLMRLRTMLKERFQLEPIILSEIAGEGRPIITKLTDVAKSVAFAFALLTPDDLVNSAEEYLQARPNVMIEIGLFYGLLGTDRVCLLYKENTKIPSDLYGIQHIPFRDSVDEVYMQIETELSAAKIIE